MFSLATLGVTIAMAVQFKTGGPRFQFTQIYQWIPQFGVHYAVGVDGIALVLILHDRRADAGGGAGVVERRRGPPGAAGAARRPRAATGPVEPRARGTA